MPKITFESPEEAIQHLMNRIENLEADLNAQLLINAALITAVEVGGVVPAGQVAKICRDQARALEGQGKDSAGIRMVREALETQFSSLGKSADVIRGKFDT
ncbi:MAG: hypothetical protein ACU0AU_06850 [Cognatishimia activa]